MADLDTYPTFYPDNLITSTSSGHTQGSNYGDDTVWYVRYESGALRFCISDPESLDRRRDHEPAVDGRLIRRIALEQGLIPGLDLCQATLAERDAQIAQLTAQLNLAKDTLATAEAALAERDAQNEYLTACLVLENERVVKIRGLVAEPLIAAPSD